MTLRTGSRARRRYKYASRIESLSSSHSSRQQRRPRSLYISVSLSQILAYLDVSQPVDCKPFTDAAWHEDEDKCIITRSDARSDDICRVILNGNSSGNFG